jgi:hypothetical protein
MTGKNKINSEKIKVDDIMSFVYYTKVKSVVGEMIVVQDLDDGDKEIAITGKELLEKSFSADQHEREENVSKTRAAEILVHSPNRPLTVCFLKAEGEERVLRGRLVKPEPLLGRSMVEDLDLKTDHRLRQVDHRTIKWLVVDAVKYTVK